MFRLECRLDLNLIQILGCQDIEMKIMGYMFLLLDEKKRTIDSKKQIFLGTIFHLNSYSSL